MNIKLVDPIVDAMNYKQMLADEQDLEIDVQNDYYKYMYSEKLNDYVGEVSYRFDHDLKKYVCHVFVSHQYKHKGIGKIGLNLLCNEAKQNGIHELYKMIPVYHPLLQLFTNNGFEIVKQNEKEYLVKKEL